MKNFKYKIVRFIANLLDVPIVAPLLHTINISHNQFTSFDISKLPLNGIVNIDITNCPELKELTLPKFELTTIKICKN